MFKKDLDRNEKLMFVLVTILDKILLETKNSYVSSCLVLIKFLDGNKIIYPKYSKHWPYTVAHTIDCVCSKMYVKLTNVNSKPNFQNTSNKKSLTPL